MLWAAFTGRFRAPQIGSRPKAAKRQRPPERRAQRAFPCPRRAVQRAPRQRVEVVVPCGRGRGRSSPRGRAGARTPAAGGRREDDASARLRRRRRVLPRCRPKALTSADWRVAPYTAHRPPAAAASIRATRRAASRGARPHRSWSRAAAHALLSRLLASRAARRSRPASRATNKSRRSCTSGASVKHRGELSVFRSSDRHLVAAGPRHRLCALRGARGGAGPCGVAGRDQQRSENSRCGAREAHPRASPALR